MTRPAGTSAAHQPGRTNAIIDRWLNERQTLISQMVEVSHGTDSTGVDAFRDTLMHYICAGHFEEFAQREASDGAFDLSGMQLLNALYPHIQESTDAALIFNEHCRSMSHSATRTTTLRHELGELTQQLTDRFQLEDQLISFVHHPASRIPYQ